MLTLTWDIDILFEKGDEFEKNLCNYASVACEQVNRQRLEETMHDSSS